MRFLGHILVVSTLSLGMVSSASADSHVGRTTAALCRAQDLEGVWNNIDSNTRGITRIEILFACNDTGGNDPDTIQVWGACSPRDCDWGRSELSHKFWNGREAQYTYLEAVDRKSFVETHLEIIKDGDEVIVASQTDFRDPGRRDFTSVERFRK